MSVTVSALYGRVRNKLQELDGRNAIGIAYGHQILRDKYIEMQAKLPLQYSYTANAGTISAASDTLTLPTSSSAEYGPDIRIQLVNTGMWLTKVSQDEMTAMRDGQSASDPGGDPTSFAPYETSSQSIICWLFPRNRTAQNYNLFRQLLAADFSTTDIAGTTLALSTWAADALVHKTAAALALAPKLMQGIDRDTQRLYRETARLWNEEGEVLIYREAKRRHDIESIGRHQRFVA